MENGSSPLFGVMEMRKDGKGGGWNFPQRPNQNHPPKLGKERWRENVLYKEFTILSLIITIFSIIFLCNKGIIENLFKANFPSSTKHM